MNERELWDTMEKALKPIARRSREDAEDVYRCLCNTAWVPVEGIEGWTWGDPGIYLSWRSAGAFVAGLRGEGEDYMDFYCSGKEGTITREIRETLEKKGLRPLT